VELVQREKDAIKERETQNKKVLDRLKKEKKQRAKEEALAKQEIDRLWREEEEAELNKMHEAREMQVRSLLALLVCFTRCKKKKVQTLTRRARRSCWRSAPS
jgi:hypothetical protein